MLIGVVALEGKSGVHGALKGRRRRTAAYDDATLSTTTDAMVMSGCSSLRFNGTIIASRFARNAPRTIWVGGNAVCNQTIQLIVFFRISRVTGSCLLSRTCSIFQFTADG